EPPDPEGLPGGPLVGGRARGPRSAGDSFRTPRRPTVLPSQVSPPPSTRELPRTAVRRLQVHLRGSAARRAPVPCAIAPERRAEDNRTRARGSPGPRP